MSDSQELEAAISAAVSVIRAASIGDQNFIPCLRGEEQQTTRLRHAIVALAECLRDTPDGCCDDSDTPD